MEDMIPCSVKDQEVFQRVWQRVMEGRSDADSPIQSGPLNMEGDLSCECLEALARRQGEGFPPECRRQERETQPVKEITAMEEAVRPSGCQRPEGQPAQGDDLPMEPEPSLREPEPEDMTSGWRPVEDMPAPEEPCGQNAGDQGLPEEEGRDRGNDLPRLWEEPQPSDDRTARLRRHVMDALEGWQFYRHLAKRARGMDQRALNSMAGELHKEARRLSAAYFLLTGLRYWPTELLGAPAIPSYWGALRTRHQAEQRQENAYRLAADDWEDPDLLAVYNQLIEGCRRRSQQLRSLLEQGDT